MKNICSFIQLFKLKYLINPNYYFLGVVEKKLYRQESQSVNSSAQISEKEEDVSSMTSGMQEDLEEFMQQQALQKMKKKARESHNKALKKQDSDIDS